MAGITVEDCLSKGLTDSPFFALAVNYCMIERCLRSQ